MKSSPEKSRPQQVRKKQIESTLNELHRLQAQIYQLNIPQNPHSSAPVKKQVKQLTYLYQNMIKPKTKNNLNISKQDISEAINFIERSNGQGPSVVDSRKLGSLMKKMFGGELEVGLIKKGDNRPGNITVDQLYDFINFNEFDNFDPLRETYNMFVDDNQRFNFKKYEELHSLIGLPAISNQRIFKQTLGLTSGEVMTYQKFCEIVRSKN